MLGAFGLTIDPVYDIGACGPVVNLEQPGFGRIIHGLVVKGHIEAVRELGQGQG